MQLLKDLHDKDFDYIKTIIKDKIANYFFQNNYSSIESLKQTSTFSNQMKILTAIDFYSKDKLWDYGSYIAEDNRFYWKHNAEFFNEKKAIYNVTRYVRGGYDGRVLSFMNDILTDENKLNEIINQINK